MTPGELNLLGIVAAEASAYQQNASFQTKVALEMLKGPKEEAWTAASEALWQEATDRVIEHGVADAISRDVSQGQQAKVIDTEVTPKYDKENGQEALDNGAGETNQDILRRESPVGGSGGRSEDTGTLRNDDSVLPGEGISEEDSGEILPVSDPGGITDYDDDFDHFDGRAGIDTEGRSIPEELASRLRGTTVLDYFGNLIAVYHGTTEMDFTTFEKGDTGFHFGTYEQASTRIKDKKAVPRRIIRAYLNIQKPLYTDTDIGQWNATPFSYLS